MKARLRLHALLATACVLSVASAYHATGELIPRSVVSSGATNSAGGGRLLRGTLGQPVVGLSQSPTHIALRKVLFTP